MENPLSNQKFKGKECDISCIPNLKGENEDEIRTSEDGNCHPVTDNDVSANVSANNQINDDFFESQNNLINTDNDRE